MGLRFFSIQARITGAIALCLAVAHGQSAGAAVYTFTTVAGASSAGSADGTGSAAHFNQPADVFADHAGNIYVADTGNDTIRKLSGTGSVTTLAGSPGQMGSTDGTGSAARFRSPAALTADTSGNVFVADSGNFVIRKIDATGSVTTLAGFAGEPGNVDGVAPAARLGTIAGIAVDGAGNVFVADATNFTIRKIDPSGQITTFAGTAGVSGTADGTGTAAQFSLPGRMTIDPSGNLFVADRTFYPTDTIIRKITPGGVVTTLHNAGGIVSVDGPSGLAVDGSNNLFVSEFSEAAILKIDPTGVITPVAGGNSTSGPFFQPSGLGVDASGRIIVADTGNNQIKAITLTGTVSTLAGVSPADALGAIDGSGSAARFVRPNDVGFEPTGGAYITDDLASTVRHLAADGTVTTLAGQAGLGGTNDGTGAAARFETPGALSVDGAGNALIADENAGQIRKVTAQGVATTLAGKGSNGLAIPFINVSAVAVGPDGTVYFSAVNYFKIQAVSSSGEVSTLAGSGVAGTADGSGVNASFGNCFGLAVDAAGNIFVSDTTNHTIRKITPSGTVSTFAGHAGQSGAADGVGTAAYFNEPWGLAVDKNGNLFVADYGNHSVRLVAPDGTVKTIGGDAQTPGEVDGPGAVARFESPTGITVNDAGDLLVTSGSVIRKGQIAGPPAISAQPASITVAAGAAVQFSVTASGTPAPTYQWNFKGSPISGATAATYSFSNAGNSDAGDYTVVVTNSLGSVTSAKATLTVSTATSSGSSAPASSDAGGGGGGGIEPWFVVALAAASVLRMRGDRKKAETPSPRSGDGFRP